MKLKTKRARFDQMKKTHSEIIQDQSRDLNAYALGGDYTFCACVFFATTNQPRCTESANADH